VRAEPACTRKNSARYPDAFSRAATGRSGAKSVYEHLGDELVMTMRLAGTPSIKSIVSS
jgi:isopentenyl diphosphate isomerase/L-lactate dehydrogenase-like FMN-dependent dehydrogenase